MKPPRRRVLWVDHVTRILGGAEINLLELLACPAARDRWDSTVACDPAGRLHAALADTGLPCHAYGLGDTLGTLRVVGRRFSLLRALRAWRALAHARRQLDTLVASTRPDFVVSCTNKDHFAAWPACRRHQAKSVWWVNDILSPDFFPWAARRAFRNQARKGADRLIAVSEFARAALGLQGVPGSRTVAIPNGIPLDRYERRPRGTLRHALQLTDDEPLAAVVGRWTPWKGQRFFLELARGWCLTHPRGHFALIGHAFNEDQAYESGLHAFVATHGLRERVHFIPFQRSIAEALSDVDLLVHTSLKPEPFGRVLIEAMAVGVPVLAARAGGVPEIIEHDVNGMLAPPGDLRAYSDALGRLMEDAGRRDRLADAARREVRQRFALDRVAADFETLFRTLD